MLLFNYYMSRLISKMRVPAIKNSSIDDNAFVDSGCVIIDSSLGRYSYLNENCNIFGARIGSFTSIGSNCQMGGENTQLFLRQHHRCSVMVIIAFTNLFQKIVGIKQMKW